MTSNLLSKSQYALGVKGGVLIVKHISRCKQGLSWQIDSLVTLIHVCWQVGQQPSWGTLVSKGFLKEVSYLSLSGGVGADSTASVETQLAKTIESVKQGGRR